MHGDQQQSVGIMLSRIKFALPDIRQALLEINDQKFSIDDLKLIGKNLPTSEEVRFIAYLFWLSKLNLVNI
jgi:hypothetical protein